MFDYVKNDNLFVQNELLSFSHRDAVRSENYLNREEQQ